MNGDKIMQVCWDFDASRAQTRRVSALDKASIKIEVQMHYFVTIFELKVIMQLFYI